MDEAQQPPSYDASNKEAAGYSNPNYQTAYPPAHGYLPQQPQQQYHFPQQQQQQQPQQQYTSVGPPIIQQPVTNPTTSQSPPTYDESEKVYVDDVENNVPVVRNIVSFNDRSVRLGFIRKVFAIVMLQMLVTVGMTAWFMFHEPTKQYVQNSRGLYIGSYVTFVGLYFVLVCCTNVAKRFPSNIVLLAIFTLALGYLVAAISTFHETKIVLAAFGMTIFCTLCVIAFASQTKYDITKCSGVLFCITISLLVFGIFAGVLVPYGHMRVVNVVYAGVGALLFMGFLAFDIQTLIGGKKYELSPDDYVYAAIQLYIDVIYIFLFILQLFNGGK